MCVIVDTHKICLINVFRVSCTVAHNNNNKSRVIEVHQSGCEEQHRELSRWNKCSVPGLKSVFVWETMALVSYTSNKSCIKVTHADRLMMSGHKKSSDHFQIKVYTVCLEYLIYDQNASLPAVWIEPLRSQFSFLACPVRCINLSSICFKQISSDRQTIPAHKAASWWRK